MYGPRLRIASLQLITALDAQQAEWHLANLHFFSATRIIEQTNNTGTLAKTPFFSSAPIHTCFIPREAIDCIVTSRNL